MTDTRQERFDHGWQTVSRINGPAARAQFEALGAVFPDFARHIVESAYGDVLGRPGLSLRDRELATVAALTVMGNAAPQLKAHVTGALNCGLTREEICEVIMQMAVYAGVPAAINAMLAAKAAFDGA